MKSSFRDWDCTALFQATLYAKTFALPDSKGTMKSLGELYLKNRKPVPGPFHSSVTSPSADPNETIALAIDQLRLLKNTLCHSCNPCVVKVTFDDYVKYAKQTFTAVNLNAKIQKERNDSYQFLKCEVKEDIKETTDGLKKIETKIDHTNKKLNELLVNQNTEGMLLYLGLLTNGLLLSAIHDMHAAKRDDRLEIGRYRIARMTGSDCI